MNVPGNLQQQMTAGLGLAGRDAIHYHTGSATANETISILLTQRVNVITTDDTYTLTATLPPVAEAAGMIFSFYIISDGGQDLTITDADDDADFDDVTFADANDRGLLYSDGIHWHFIDTGGSTAS